MIYTEDSEYKVKFYRDPKSDKSSVLEYIDRLPEKERAKVLKYIEFLRGHRGILDEPYSKHMKGKIRELRVDFSRNRHRIFYFLFIKKTIILLHVFSKTTAKTPRQELRRAEINHHDTLLHPHLYE